MANVGSNVVIKMEADASQVDLGMQRATRATKKFKDETKKTQGQMRLMRGGLGQMGHQVQDIAVQLQSGQNAMLVFGQQGSQIASLFGQNGAIIGAFLAVGAAIATALMPKFFAASDAMKEVEDQVDSLVDRYDELSGASRLEAISQANDRFEALDTVIKEAQEDAAKYTKRIGEVGVAFNYSEEQVEEFRRKVQVANATIEEAKRQKAELEKKIDGVTDAYEKESKRLKEQIGSYGLAGAAAERYRINLMALNGEISDTERLELLGLVDQLQAKEDAAAADKKREKDKQKRFKDQQKEISKALKEQEKTARKFADTIGDGFVNAITGAMSFKDAMKNVAKSVVNDLISMIVKKQITDRIFGALMGMTTFKPETTANPVKAQEINVPLDLPELPTDFNIPDFDPGTFGLTSNEGGGFTGRGARSGGIDGKGGFLSILHPNETVIDHTRGQSTGGTVVNQTINISTGVSQTVRAEIANMMPQIQEATKAAVADSRARGGSYSKALLGV